MMSKGYADFSPFYLPTTDIFFGVCVLSKCQKGEYRVKG